MEGYIKTNFLETHNNKINKIIGCGSLTDGEFKIEVHITNFLNDDYFALDINKGDEVEIIGVMQTAGNKYVSIDPVSKYLSLL